MNNRRIVAQPGDSIEIMDSFGNSLLKVTSGFQGANPAAVLYHQPGIAYVPVAVAKDVILSQSPSIRKESFTNDEEHF